jgi:hypothetical protein
MVEARGLLALEAAGIAVTVPPFVMIEDRLRHTLKTRRFACEQVRETGMRLDDLPFFRRQRPRLGEDAVGDARHPEVV